MNASLASPSVSTQRVSNFVKTAVLLAAMSALVLGVGQVIGGAQGLLWAGAIVLVMNLGSFWFSDSLALKMNRARALKPGELPWLETMTADLARAAKLPKTPRLYVVDSPTPNAFATGRSPEKAAVAVTTGLLQLMGRRELAGVLAHELSHVKNRDTLIMTVAATLAGVISHVAQMAFWFGGSFLRHDDDDEGSNPLVALGLLIVAPLTATLIQLAISRSREFDADAAAVEITGDPQGLASALSRLEQGNRIAPIEHSPATAHLFIVNPLSGKGVMNLFATHPPIEERVSRLLAMR